MDEAKLYQMVLILKAIVKCQVTAAGMTAENMQRQACGNSMAYTADDFAKEVDFMEAVFEVHRV